MTYQIGHLIHPDKADPKHDDYREALGKAQEGSIDDDVWAVWSVEDDGNATIEAIVYGGEEYR